MHRGSWHAGPQRECVRQGRPSLRFISASYRLIRNFGHTSYDDEQQDKDLKYAENLLSISEQRLINEMTICAYVHKPQASLRRESMNSCYEENYYET